jgi:hypothetical protein
LRLTTAVVRGLIDRDVAGGLTLTKQGRAVLAALLMEDEYTLSNGAGKQGNAGTGKGKGAIKAAACPICEFQTMPPHDGRTHRNQKKKGPFSAAELKEKGLVKV